MTNFSFNPKIEEKIDDMDADPEYKNFLKNILDFEKLQTQLGDKEYTREYDKRITKLVEKMEKEGLG